MFIGIKDYLTDFVSLSLTYTVDTNIHHVENWGSIVDNFLNNQDCWGEAKISKGAGIEELKNSEYYKDSITYGKKCQRNYVANTWVRKSLLL